MDWRDAGKIGYALGPDVTTLCLSTDSRQFGFAHPPRDFAGQIVLLLVPDPAERMTEEAKRWFRTLQALPGASIRLRGRVLQTVSVLQGQGLQAPVAQARTGRAKELENEQARSSGLQPAP